MGEDERGEDGTRFRQMVERHAAAIVATFWFCHWLNRRGARKLREEAARLLDERA